MNIIQIMHLSATKKKNRDKELKNLSLNHLNRTYIINGENKINCDKNEFTYNVNFLIIRSRIQIGVGLMMMMLLLLLLLLFIAQVSSRLILVQLEPLGYRLYAVQLIARRVHVQAGHCLCSRDGSGRILK